MTDPRSILNEIPFCLARATLDFKRFNDQTLLAVGLERMAPGLATVLHALEAYGPCSVNQLIEKTHLPNGTLTGLLDSLQRDGYIYRNKNPNDRRSWFIALTDHGISLVARLHERHQLTMDFFDQTFTENELIEFVRLLEKAIGCMRSFTHKVVEV